MSNPLPTVRTNAGRTAKVLIGAVAVFVLLLGVLAFARPSTTSTGPDQVALHHKGGAFSSKRIKVLGREGYLKQYAIDHGQNPYQPSTNSLITGNQ